MYLNIIKDCSKVKIFHNSVDNCIEHIKKNFDELYEWWDPKLLKM